MTAVALAAIEAAPGSSWLSSPSRARGVLGTALAKCIG